MGAYLRKPETKKNSINGHLTLCGQKCPYGVTTMQGWRVTMEDSYTVQSDFEENIQFFGVFDGHGGKEVAVYCSQHLHEFLKASKSYMNDDMGIALRDAFMTCDRSLLMKEAIKEMKTTVECDMPTEPEEDNEDESDDNIDMLVKEANMPIEDVLMKCVNDKKLVKSLVDLANKGLGSHDNNDEETTCSDNNQEINENGTNDSKVKPRKFRVYEKFFQELIMQDGPLSKELGSIIDEMESTSEEEEVDIEEGEEEGDIEEGEEEGDIEDRERNDEEEESRMDGKDQGEVERHESESEGDKEKDCKGESVQDTTIETRLGTSKPNYDNNMTSVTKPLNNSCHGMSLRRKRSRENDITASNKRLCVDSDNDYKDSHNDYKDSEGYESGTTAVVCLIRNGEITVANAGDSRCVLSSKGVAIDMSLDHKPTDPLELARIEKAGGHVDEDLRVDGGLNLSRAIGDHMYKENSKLPLEEQMITALPDIKTRTILIEDEFLVLGTDGIWNCMGSQKVIDFIRKKLIQLWEDKKTNLSTIEESDLQLAKICEELCDTCLAPDTNNDGTGCDNMTVILTLLKPFDKLFQS